MNTYRQFNQRLVSLPTTTGRYLVLMCCRHGADEKKVQAFFIRGCCDKAFRPPGKMLANQPVIQVQFVEGADAYFSQFFKMTVIERFEDFAKLVTYFPEAENLAVAVNNVNTLTAQKE
jgi:hypothetical protein